MAGVTSMAGASSLDPSPDRESSSSGHDAVWIGQEFLRQYYRVIAKCPQRLHKLYKDDSRLTVSFYNNQDCPQELTAAGRQDIQTALEDIFLDSQFVIGDLVAQPSFSGSILLQIGGEMQRSYEDGPRPFVQVFLLAPQENGYYVLNDVLSLLPVQPEGAAPFAVHYDTLSEQEAAVAPSIDCPTPAAEAVSKSTLVPAPAPAATAALLPADEISAVVAKAAVYTAASYATAPCAAADFSAEPRGVDDCLDSSAVTPSTAAVAANSAVISPELLQTTAPTELAADNSADPASDAGAVPPAAGQLPPVDLTIWVQRGQEAITYADKVLKASCKDKHKHAKRLVTVLEKNFSSSFIYAEWAVIVTMGLPGMVAAAVVQLVYSSSLTNKDYLAVATKLLQKTAYFFSPTLADTWCSYDIQMRLKLIKQCNSSRLLPLLADELAAAAVLLSGNPATAADIISAGGSCARQALQQTTTFGSKDLQHLLYSTSLLWMFAALSNIHPEAGLLSTAHGHVAAEQAATLAAVVLESAAWAAAETEGQPGTSVAGSVNAGAAQAVESAAVVAGLFLLQLYSRLPQTHPMEVGSVEQQLLASPAVLHLLLLLIPVLHAEAIQEPSSGTSSTNNSTSSTNSTNSSLASQLQLSALDGSRSCTSLLEQYRDCVLQSFGQLPFHHYTEFGATIRGQIAAAAAAETTDTPDAHCTSAQLHLTALVYALEQFSRRCYLTAEEQSVCQQGPRHSVLCLLLVPTIQALLSVFVQYHEAGQPNLSKYALDALYLSCGSLFRLTESREHAAQDPHITQATAVLDLMSFYYAQAQVIPSFMHMLLEAIQLVLEQQPSADSGSAAAVTADGNSSETGAGCSSGLPAAGICCLGSSSDCGDNSSSDITGLAVSQFTNMLSALLNTAPVAVAIHALSTIAPDNLLNSRDSHLQLKQTAVSLFEQAMRSVAAAAAATGCTQPLESFVGAALGVPSLFQTGLTSSFPHKSSSRPYWTLVKLQQRVSCITEQATAATAGAALDTVQCPAAITAGSMSMEHKQLHALLLTSIKLGIRVSSPCSESDWNVHTMFCTIHDVAGGMINNVVIEAGGGPPDAADLPAAVPWMYVLARWLIGSGAILTSKLGVWSKTSTSTAGEEEDAAANVQVDMDREIEELEPLLQAVQYTVEYIRPYAATAAISEQVQRCAGGDGMVWEGVAAVALACGFPEVVQHWDQGLMPLLEQATDLLRYVELFQHCQAEERQTCFNCLTGEVAAVAAQLDEHAESVTAQAKLLAGSFLQQLPKQLEAAGEQLCALLPLPLCCNNPWCGNMSGQSELQLVGGKACVCAGCEVARYCGQECQAAHWQAHKRVCKMIKRSRANAAQRWAEVA